MRNAMTAVLLVLLSLPSWARHSPPNFFRATHDSVRLENERADSMGVPRYLTRADMLAAEADGRLVSLDLTASPKLPNERRYALPATVAFITQLFAEFQMATGDLLTVDSAIRPADVQKKLRRTNRNAAPADGLRASSHERGTTVDVSRKMSSRDQRWLVGRLLYYRATGRILVIQERACLHIFVGGQNE
jgi:hypothetical protein